MKLVVSLILKNYNSKTTKQPNTKLCKELDISPKKKQKWKWKETKMKNEGNANQNKIPSSHLLGELLS